jgi:hypothetical protein
MLILQEACDPELAEVFGSVAKLKFSKLFGIELFCRFDFESGNMIFEFQDTITEKLMGIFSDTCKVSKNNAIVASGVIDNSNEVVKQPVGRPKINKIRVNSIKNRKSFRVEDPEAIAVCKFYFNRDCSNLWEEKANIFFASASRGIERYNMTWLDWEISQEGFAQIKVGDLVGVAIYDAFNRIKNFAASSYARQNKDQTPEVLEQIKMWGVPSKWSVVIEYSNGDKQTAIEYDWNDK